MFLKMWPLEYQKVIRTYLRTYLRDSSDSRDSCDSCDISDSSDSGDSSDSSDNSSVLFHKYTYFLPKNILAKKHWKLNSESLPNIFLSPKTFSANKFWPTNFFAQKLYSPKPCFHQKRL